VNHQADIEEGFEVFDDERERNAAEVHFLNHPSLVTFKVKDRDFTAKTVRTIHLVGSSRTGGTPSHPFDFEEGYIAANGSFGDLPPLFAIEVRWSDYGRRLHVSA
jgi:hypothetical protein